MRPLHVLLVDDDTLVRTAVGRGFREAGYRLTDAGDGREALRLLRAELRPDVIVLDLLMPVMSGEAFLSARKGGPYEGIPVIVVSGYVGTALANGTLAGASRVMRKPVEMQALLDACEELVAARPAPSPRTRPSATSGSEARP